MTPEDWEWLETQYTQGMCIDLTAGMVPAKDPEWAEQRLRILATMRLTKGEP